jgi:hypothetical protein
MKFRYLVQYDDNDLTGTNDEDLARELIYTCRVLDAEAGTYLTADGDIDIEEELSEVEE